VKDISQRWCVRRLERCWGFKGPFHDEAESFSSSFLGSAHVAALHASSRDAAENGMRC
jgi:hypothetical protein